LFLLILGGKKLPNFNDQRKTTITGISRRRPTIDQDSIEHAQSAPTSPALLRTVKHRSSHNYIIMDPMDVVRTQKYFKSIIYSLKRYFFPLLERSR
jgi:translation elongation factor EF-Tu-like GTPase